MYYSHPNANNYPNVKCIIRTLNNLTTTFSWNLGNDLCSSPYIKEMQKICPWPFSGFLCVEINVKVCAKVVDENGSLLNVKRLNIHVIGVK